MNTIKKANTIATIRNIGAVGVPINNSRVAVSNLSGMNNEKLVSVRLKVLKAILPNNKSKAEMISQINEALLKKTNASNIEKRNIPNIGTVKFRRTKTGNFKILGATPNPPPLPPPPKKKTKKQNKKYGKE